MWKLWIIFAGVFLFSCQEAQAPDASTSENQDVVITKVVDGDTVKALIFGRNEYIRVIGIDAPEKDECFSNEAADKMRELVEGKVVTLFKKPDEERDQYNRLLRYISIRENDVGAALIEGGYAESFPWFPHPRSETYNQLERQARAAKLGLWGNCVD